VISCHAFTFDLQEKCSFIRDGRIEDQGVLFIFDSKVQGACRYCAQNGDPSAAADIILAISSRDIPSRQERDPSGRPRASSDMTFTLQGVQMLDGGSRPGKVELPGYLPEGRGIAITLDVIQDVIQDLLLTRS